MANNNGFLNNDSIFSILYEWRKTIIIVALLSVIISSITSLFIENKYQSEVILFPTKNLSSGKALLNEYNDFLEIGGDEELEHMMQILGSEDIMKRIVKRFNLIEYYGIDVNEQNYESKLRKKYASSVDYNITKFSSISIRVLDKNPRMAADIANKIASLIDTVIHQLHRPMAEQGYQSLIKDRDFGLYEIKLLEDSIAKIRSLGINDYESQSEVLNEQWAVAKIKNNHDAARAIQKKIEVLSKYGGQYSALRDNLEHARGRLNYVLKKMNEHKLTAEEQLEHKFIVNSAMPALEKSYPVRSLIVIISCFSSVLFVSVLILLQEKIKEIKVN